MNGRKTEKQRMDDFDCKWRRGWLYGVRRPKYFTIYYTRSVQGNLITRQGNLSEFSGKKIWAGVWEPWMFAAFDWYDHLTTSMWILKKWDENIIWIHRVHSANSGPTSCCWPHGPCVNHFTNYQSSLVIYTHAKYIHWSVPEVMCHPDTLLCTHFTSIGVHQCHRNFVITDTKFLLQL